MIMLGACGLLKKKQPFTSDVSPMIVYLHIGTYKTATTFLQHGLYHNFKDPSGALYYPRTGIYGTAHHYLATSRFPGWTNGVTAAAYEKAWNRLLKNLNRSDADIAVLSSEMFCSLSEADIQYVRSALQDYSVRAIVYIRRQDQYISSLAAQMVKGCNGKPENYMNLDTAIQTVTNSKQFNYGSMCTNWARVLGEKNLIVRPFERAQLHQENILADFFHHVTGMQVPDSVVFPAGNLNPRLCRDALEFKQLVNRLPVDRDTMNATLPGLFSYSEAVDAQTCNTYQEHVLLSPSRRQEIMQSCAEINAHIARTFLGRDNGILFEEPLTEPETRWKPYPGLDSATLEKIISFLDQTTPGVAELLTRAALNMDLPDQEMQKFTDTLKRRSNANPAWKRNMPGFVAKWLSKLIRFQHRRQNG